MKPRRPLQIVRKLNALHVRYRGMEARRGFALVAIDMVGFQVGDKAVQEEQKREMADQSVKER